jgi:regulator of replication initiation timing
MYWILSMEEQTPSAQQVIEKLLDRIKELTAENEDLKRRLTNVWGET